MKTTFRMQQDIYGNWEQIAVKEDDVFPESFVEEVNSPTHYTHLQRDGHPYGGGLFHCRPG